MSAPVVKVTQWKQGPPKAECSCRGENGTGWEGSTDSQYPSPTQNPCCVWSRMGRRWTLRSPHTSFSRLVRALPYILAHGHSVALQQSQHCPAAQKNPLQQPRREECWLGVTRWPKVHVDVSKLLGSGDPSLGCKDWAWETRDAAFVCVSTPQHQAQQSPSCVWPVRKGSAWGNRSPLSSGTDTALHPPTTAPNTHCHSCSIYFPCGQTFVLCYQ